jgi:hypothetical protein
MERRYSWRQGTIIRVLASYLFISLFKIYFDIMALVVDYILRRFTTNHAKYYELLHYNAEISASEGSNCRQLQALLRYGVTAAYDTLSYSEWIMKCVLDNEEWMNHEWLDE